MCVILLLFWTSLILQSLHLNYNLTIWHHRQIKGVSMPRFGCFFAKSPKGGISDPKNFTADFLYLKRYILVVNFGKNVQKGGRGGVISNPKNFIANLRKLAHIYELSQKKAQCNFQKVTGEGGVKAVWTFFKKTSIFGSLDVP